MTIDVVCAGAPFLDLVFRGLPRLPEAGEEVLARELLIVPGGMANVAFALRQLGLESVVCAPIGIDPAGRFLKDLMDDADIPWLGGPTDATSVSVGLPQDGDRAFVSVHPGVDVDVDAIAALSPRAVVANLPLPTGMPEGSLVYGVVGDPQVALLLDRPAELWASLRTVFLNEREAAHLSGHSAADEGARFLARRGCAVVVTLGARGSLAALPDGRVVETPGQAVAALDTVGAGDLFTAAFIWADLAGHRLEDALAIASAYAAHSLVAPGSRQKGLGLAEFRTAAQSSASFEGPLLEVRG